MVRQLVRLSRLAIPIVLVSLGVPQPATAQSYPPGMIRFVTGGAAGSPSDIIIRIVANELGQSEGWQIVVENKPGGLGTIADGEVLKQPADGHTIRAIGITNSVYPALHPNIGFRLDTDFAPVIKLSSAHHVLVVNPAVPAKSLPELVALLKSQPDKFNFSSGGFGTPAHLTGELFKLQTGARVAHVPYQAGGQMIADLMNGTNHYPVHHAAARARPDCHRQVACTRRHGATADAGPEGCSHRRRGGISEARHPGLGRPRREARHVGRHRHPPERSDQQSPGEAPRARGVREDRR
jgi:tripartite-type tricarboxylate transporter receptor subunit TctC